MISGINSKQLRRHVIGPALSIDARLNSHAAEVLLLATCAQETHCGEWLVQIHGPALGLFQMEPHTYDLVRNFLTEKEAKLARKIRGPVGFSHSRVVWDLHHAVLMARADYWSEPTALPSINRDEMWNYYKRYYNSAKGAATKNEWDINWNSYVVPALY